MFSCLFARLEYSQAMALSFWRFNFVVLFICAIELVKMENEKKYTCAQAKEIDLVRYLAGMGFEPVKIRGSQYWYLSPFRHERTASFKVDRNLNRWYDFGEGKGGSIIDFAIRYMDCSIGEFLESLEQTVSPFSFLKPPDRNIALNKPVNVVLSDMPVLSWALCDYLKERRISMFLADRYLREVRYTNSGKTFFGLGFRNSNSGWEIRSRNFKGSASPKYYTHFDNGHKAICVFEGFMDFLSFHQLVGAMVDDYDFLILNSLSIIQKSILVLSKYELANLYLDNDNAGNEATLLIQSEISNTKDCRNLYKGHKDLNEFLCCSTPPK